MTGETLEKFYMRKLPELRENVLSMMRGSHPELFPKEL